jgi:hydrogenase maturation protein HypF
MKGFPMCARCQAEYDDPRDRRFHAQPNACPQCGPHLELWDRAGKFLRSHDAALRAAVEAMKAGGIVAVKGLGGFHLMVAASHDRAVRRMRELKHREEKPLAVMFPSLEAAQSACDISPLEERLLRSPEAPIVLLRRREPSSVTHHASRISGSVAPDNPYLGAMLPYTPLHHLLLADLGAPVVATSGNVSDEPICIDNQEAVERLGKMVDLLLVHDRPIVRHVDDSVVRAMAGRELVLRRARGFAPLPVECLRRHEAPALAVGAHLKNAVALAAGSQVFLSQHIGDLETAPALAAFRRVIDDLQRLYDARPAAVVADLHPDYLSTQFARQAGLPVVQVQHHYAHVLACMAENELEPPVLGVSWDGTGYGPDGTVWGGEFLRANETGFERVAHLRPFPLPGGDQAAREPRRSALGLLFALLGEAAFDQTDLPTLRAFSGSEQNLLRKALTLGVNCPQTSSAGRLFDAVASLIGLRQRSAFEGQAAMALEFAIGEQEWMNDEGRRANQAAAPPVNSSFVIRDSPFVLDWSPLLHALLAGVREGLSPEVLSARFHAALVEAVVTVARRVGVPRVALSGGCFQNKVLTEQAVRRLRAEGFRVYWHQRVPPNDGGLCLGQIAALRQRAAHPSSLCA